MTLRPKCTSPPGADLAHLSLLPPANLLSFRLQGCLASRAFVAVAADVDSLQAFGASPPGVRSIAAFEPVLFGGNSTLFNVFLVKVSQVVAKVVTTVKRIAAPATAGVIAMIRVLLRRGSVLVFVVTVEIGATLEGFCIAAGVKAAYWIVTATRGKSMLELVNHIFRWRSSDAQRQLTLAILLARPLPGQ